MTGSLDPSELEMMLWRELDRVEVRRLRLGGLDCGLGSLASISLMSMTERSGLSE